MESDATPHSDADPVTVVLPGTGGEIAGLLLEIEHAHLKLHAPRVDQASGEALRHFADRVTSAEATASPAPPPPAAAATESPAKGGEPEPLVFVSVARRDLELVVAATASLSTSRLNGQRLLGLLELVDDDDVRQLRRRLTTAEPVFHPDDREAYARLSRRAYGIWRAKRATHLVDYGEAMRTAGWLPDRGPS